MINKELQEILDTVQAYRTAIQYVVSKLPEPIEYTKGNTENYEQWIFISGIRQGYKTCLKQLGIDDARIREIKRGATGP